MASPYILITENIDYGVILVMIVIKINLKAKLTLFSNGVYRLCCLEGFEKKSPNFYYDNYIDF